MKRLIIVLLVLGALGYLAKSADTKSGNGGFWATWKTDKSGNAAPEVITDPVYAEIRFHTEIHDRSFQAVALAKAIDESDCKHATEVITKRIEEESQDPGYLKWTQISSECNKHLDSRTQRLFDNKPTFVNYISAARGAPDEREERRIIWGVTAEEGDEWCAAVLSHAQKDRRGEVKCIHALPTQ